MAYIKVIWSNFMKQLKTVEQIYKLANKGKSIVLANMYRKERRVPAAFVINYQAHYLVGILRAGRVFEYKKLTK